jgi:zinc protease
VTRVRAAPVRVTCVLVALALTRPWPAAPQSPPDPAPAQMTLDNGLRVIVAENPSVPLATVLVAVRNGAFTQEARDEGLAHLYEHLLFRSYGGDPADYWRAVGAFGGRSNGTTAEEVVTYFVQVPSKKVNDAMKLMARLVQEARFTERDLTVERPVVLDELRRDQADPEQALARAVSRKLWGDAWSRKDIGGDSASLAGITVARLRETYARYYLPNNAALIVTGDVSASDVFRAAEKHFGRWKRGPDPFAEEPPAALEPERGQRKRAVIMGSPVSHVTILLQYRGPSVARDPAATYAADVLFGVVNAAGSSFQRRLVDAGPFLEVGGAYLTQRLGGPITIRGQTTPERAQEALLSLLDELDGLDQLSGITDEDLEFAKKSRVVEDALRREHTAQLAPSLAFWWASAGMEYYASYRDRMNAQTREDVRRFAREYIVHKPVVIGVLAGPQVAGAVANWLSGASTAGSAR